MYRLLLVQNNVEIDYIEFESREQAEEYIKTLSPEIEVYRHYLSWKFISEIELDDIDTRDYPDFSDAFISSAVWTESGKELTETELEILNDDGGFVYDAVMNRLF